MTFIGFLLGLAVGIGLMFLMTGPRRGDQKQGRNNQQHRMTSPAYNTEFGELDDASQDLYTPVKPAASSAAVFQKQNTAASARQAGSNTANLSAHADPTSVASAENTALTDVTSTTAANDTTVDMADDTGNVEVENRARDSFTTNTVFNNTTNADAALNNAVINPTPGLTDQLPVNPATNGAGTAETKGANPDKQ